jgi:hypothetical protein
MPRRPRRSDVSTLRAAWWAQGALKVIRRELERGELSRIDVPSPPNLPASACRGVDAVLRRRRHSCLERALVRQRWLVAQGQSREIAIGVTPPSQGFLAHAWLVGEEDPVARRYQELIRFGP